MRILTRPLVSTGPQRAKAGTNLLLLQRGTPGPRSEPGSSHLDSALKAVKERKGTTGMRWAPTTTNYCAAPKPPSSLQCLCRTQVFFQPPPWIQLFRKPPWVLEHRGGIEGRHLNNQDHKPADQKCSAPDGVQQAPALLTCMTWWGGGGGGGREEG